MVQKHHHSSKNYYFGVAAEKVASIYLFLKGYSILERRHKTPFGEIDIIAKKGQILLIVEVKARSSNLNIEEVLTWNQINRIKKAAQFFISLNPQFQSHDVRFDFIAISRFFWPKHHKNFIS